MQEGNQELLDLLFDPDTIPELETVEMEEILNSIDGSLPIDSE